MQPRQAAPPRPAAHPVVVLGSYVTGAIGFIIGLSIAALFEALLFQGGEALFGAHMIPVGPGWVVVPFLLGSASWHAGRNFGLNVLFRRRR